MMIYSSQPACTSMHSWLALGFGTALLSALKKFIALKLPPLALLLWRPH